MRPTCLYFPRFLLVYFQLKNILECDSDARIRKELGNLPKGLDGTFVRALKRIHSHASRERLRRILQWIVCAQTLRLNSLFEALALDDMGDSWDPDKVVNDQRRLINACAHLVTVTEEEDPLVMFPHFTVYQFLTSDPMDWEETLPRYHVYPLPDAYMTIALSCAKLFSINNSPEPWDLIASVIRRFGEHADVLDEASLLSAMFSGPLQADPRPANSFLVFPRATSLKASNCTFVCCEYNAYNVFTIMNSDSWFGGVRFSDVFPEVHGHLTLDSCNLIDYRDSSPMNVYRGPVQAKTTFSTLDATHATTVTMEGYTFFHVRNSNWSIFPNIGIFRNERTSFCQPEFFDDFTDWSVTNTSLDNYYSGMFVSLHDSIIYNFGI